MAWYVGSGDSLTLLTGQEGDSAELIVQVDLNHLASGDDDEPHVPIVKQLVEILPIVDDQPYLAVFVLTHPDQDHCRGFTQLLEDENVLIGELWMTPRIFEEYKADLCDDATAFREEADRRVAVMKDGGAGSGDRLRVVGREDLFEFEELKDLPEDARSLIGSTTTWVDGWNLAGTFAAGFHGLPDVDENTDRNDTSLVMRVTLSSDDCEQRILFLGDLAHESLGSILATVGDDDLDFDGVIAPHHCSKRALFDDAGKEVGEVVDGFTDKASDGAWVVASSSPIPASDSDGASTVGRAALGLLPVAITPGANSERVRQAFPLGEVRHRRALPGSRVEVRRQIRVVRARFGRVRHRRGSAWFLLLRIVQRIEASQRERRCFAGCRGDEEIRSRSL